MTRLILLLILCWAALLASLAHAQETGIVVSKLPASTGIQATDVTLDVIPGVLTQKATYGQLAAFVAANAPTAAPSTVECNPSNSVQQIPTACAQPVFDALYVTDVQASAVTGTLNAGNLPATQVVYTQNVAYPITNAQAGAVIQQNNSSGACALTLQAIGSGQTNIAPGTQILIFNNYAVTCSITPTVPTTIGGLTTLYIGQYGWALLTADSDNSGSGNYNFTVQQGGGYTVNASGAQTYPNPLKAQDFVPTGSTLTSGQPSFSLGPAADTAALNTNGLLGLYVDALQNTHVEAAIVPDVPYTIATLPTCYAGDVGAFATISNGVTPPTYFGTVSTTGGGVDPVFCYYNGTSYLWVYH